MFNITYQITGSTVSLSYLPGTMQSGSMVVPNPVSGPSVPLTSANAPDSHGTTMLPLCMVPGR